MLLLGIFKNPIFNTKKKYGTPRILKQFETRRGTTARRQHKYMIGTHSRDYHAAEHVAATDL